MNEAQSTASETGGRAKDWWERLQPSRNGDERAGGGDRAALARLRRCSAWMDAVAVPETILLFRRLGGGDEKRLPRIAVLAMVLAHVREEDKPRDGRIPKVASAVGPKDAKDENPVLKPLRLRRLLSATSDDEILTAFRRLVALKGWMANVADLARNILNWHDERTRMKFAFDYWQAGQAAPQDETPEATGAAANA
jgi:CRISPR system Cascade subunit CasB